MARANGLLIGGSILAGMFLGPVAMVFAPAICLLVQALGGRIAVPRLLLCCLLAGLGSLRSPTPSSTIEFDAALLASSGAVGKVSSMPKAATRGQQFLFAVESVMIDDEWHARSFTALLTLPGRDINVGDSLWVAWALDAPRNLPPDFLAYVQSQGADTTALAFTAEVRAVGDSWRRPFVALRRTVSDLLATGSPGDSGALLAGLVTGDDSQLSSPAAEAFRRTGTTHITAVSGSNFALVAAVWGMLGAAGGWRRRWWLGAAIVVSVWAYAAVVGFEPPATRAAIVASLTASAVRVGRRADPLTLVVLAAAAMALTRPELTRSLSFQLSLVTSAVLVSCLPRRSDAGLRAWLSGALAGVIAAQFAALPILVATFGVWSLLSVPANLAILPLVPATFGLALVAALVGLFSPAIGTALAGIAGIGASGILRIVNDLGALATPVSMGVGGRLSLVLVAALSVLVVGCLNGDVRRWFEEFQEPSGSAITHRSLVLASLGTGVMVVSAAFLMLRW